MGCFPVMHPLHPRLHPGMRGDSFSPTELIPTVLRTAGKGHEDPFPRPGPNGRCRFGQETFAGGMGETRRKLPFAAG